MNDAAKLAYAAPGIYVSPEERAARSLDGTLPAHIPPLSTAKIDQVSRARIRRAFAELAQGNIEDVQTWLHQVAEGVEYVDENGKKCRTSPRPLDAIDAFIKLAEFTIPRVKAMAIDVSDGKSVKRMSVAELQASIVSDQ